MIGKYVKVVLKQPNCNEWTVKQYSYTSPIDLNIGDLVLVETRYGFSLGKVVKFSDTLPNSVKASDVKEVVCLCDLSAYYMRQERLTRMKELKAHMDEKVKALQEIAVFEALCSKDIELKEMLEEYKKLQDI